MLKRREECDIYQTHEFRHHCSEESPVKRWNIRSFQPTLWLSSAIDVNTDKESHLNIVACFSAIDESVTLYNRISYGNHCGAEVKWCCNVLNRVSIHKLHNIHYNPERAKDGRMASWEILWLLLNFVMFKRVWAKLILQLIYHIKSWKQWQLHRFS